MATSTTVQLADEPPGVEDITTYDRTHLATYLSLLYAVGEGHSNEEMMKDCLGIDPAIDLDRAQGILSSHLSRARWLAKNGYKLLL